MTRKCKECGKELPIEMFQIHSGTNRIYKCRACVAKTREVKKPLYTKEDLNIVTNKCIRCGEEKTLIHFSKAPTNANGYRNYCKTCDAEMKKLHRTKTKLAVRKYKEERGCAKCGESKFYMLDFHHIDPSQKEKNVSRLIDSAYAKKLWDEIAKTVLLCRNHHQEFHYLERTEGLTLEEYLK